MKTTSILLAGLCLAAPVHAFLGGAPNPPQLRSASVTMCSSSAAARPSWSRRESLARFTSLAFFAASPFSVSATPVRAPLPPGPADPADKDTLLEALGILEALASQLKDPAGWKEAQATISKAPFTPDAMGLMFRKAAKNLPPNNLLGSDAGIWAGLAVESVQATDELASELQFLVGAVEKGEKVEAGDLAGLHAAAVGKVKEFIALYGNTIESKVLPGMSRKQ